MTVDPSPRPRDDALQPPAGMRGEAGWLLRVVRDQRVAFLAVGATNTAIGLFWFTVFQLTIGQVLGYLVVLTLAHVASVLCAFVLYRRIVFKVRGHVWRDLARFESVYLVSLAVNFVLLPLLVEVVGFEVLPAQFLIVGVTTVVSYVGHKYFSFRRPRATAPAGDR